MSMKFVNRDFKKNPLTRADTQVSFDPDSPDEAPFKAQQHHNIGNSLDTTKIMQRYFENGIITHTRNDAARYIDATFVTDFREMMSKKAYADQAFDNLPIDIRKNFSNQKDFVEFVLDDKNIDTLREWGFAAPVAIQEPVPTEPIKAA